MNFPHASRAALKRFREPQLLLLGSGRRRGTTRWRENESGDEDRGEGLWEVPSKIDLRCGAVSSVSRETLNSIVLFIAVASREGEA